MYREITRNIQVDVHPEFLAERSKPEAGYYFFAYRITVINRGELPVQLLSRHWIIVDGNGRTEEVKGLGVVGEQPKIAPGASYEYSSFCPLPTPTGNMRGTYQMAYDGGEQFNVVIPLFFLRDLGSLH
jgi:ApaG protein